MITAPALVMIGVSSGVAVASRILAATDPGSGDQYWVSTLISAIGAAAAAIITALAGYRNSHTAPRRRTRTRRTRARTRQQLLEQRQRLDAELADLDDAENVL
jgi:hypothetical protein